MTIMMAILTIMESFSIYNIYIYIYIKKKEKAEDYFKTSKKSKSETQPVQKLEDLLKTG